MGRNENYSWIVFGLLASIVFYAIFYALVYLAIIFITIWIFLVIGVPVLIAIGALILMSRIQNWAINLVLAVITIFAIISYLSYIGGEKNDYPPKNIYYDTGQSIIDKETRLEWYYPWSRNDPECPDGDWKPLEVSYIEAKQECRNLEKYGRGRGWRIPSKKDYETIFIYKEFPPYDSKYFPFFDLTTWGTDEFWTSPLLADGDDTWNGTIVTLRHHRKFNFLKLSRISGSKEYKEKSLRKEDRYFNYCVRGPLTDTHIKAIIKQSEKNKQ